MSNIAKIQAAMHESETRGYPAKNLLLSKAASLALIYEVAGRGVDITLSTVCGLEIFVTDTLPDRIGVLRYYRNASGYGPVIQWPEPVNTIEFDL